MNKQVEELVERRAAEIYKWSEGGTNWVDLYEGEKRRWLEYARLALNDPDLALIDGGRLTGKKIPTSQSGESLTVGTLDHFRDLMDGFQRCRDAIIPLAEALKEQH